MRVFLAAPFTQMIDGRGSFDYDYQRYLTNIHHFLEDLGHEVISAHVREQWGSKLESPAEALAVDVAGIDDCDVLIAFIGVPPSPGVQLEIGYAIARNTPILVIANRNVGYPYLVDGLPSVTAAEIHVVGHLDETKLAIEGGLERLLGGIGETCSETGCGHRHGSLPSGSS